MKEARITPDEVTEAVLTASRVLVAVAARSLADNIIDVSLQQFRALVVLASHGPLRPVDLSEIMGVDPSTTTRLCDRLASKRLITRRRQTEDRREVLIDLSKQGRDLVAAVTEKRRAEISRIVAAVPASERSALVQAFVAFGRAAGEIPDEEWPHAWLM